MLNLNWFLFFCVTLKLCQSAEFHGRLFGRVYTSTVTESKVVTSLVPSSCVQVESTLPPCRNVRFLKFPQVPSLSFYNSLKNEEKENVQKEPKISTTALGWGEYFGFYAPTVTVTTTALFTSVVQDPSVVVTYAVKGCRPLRLPLDLDRCPPVASSISIEEILPTTTVSAPNIHTETLLPTETISLLQPTQIYEEEQSNFQDAGNALEPSSPNLTDVYLQPTQTL